MLTQATERMHWQKPVMPITNTFVPGALGLVGIAFAHGLALSIVISAFGATSGGHINPAVTIGFLVTRRITPILGILYIVAQLVGATLAGLLLRAVFPQAVWQAAQLGTPNLGPGVSFGTGILVGSGITKQDMVDSEGQSVFKKRSLQW